MDEAAIEKKGTTPLAPTMDAIAAIKTKQGRSKRLAICTATASQRFSASARCPDMHDSRQTIANIDQGGLTLPDRDYYLKDDAKSVETRQKYLEHVQRCFRRIG